MSESTTVARPYAIAAFHFAAEHKLISHWHSMLVFAAKVSRNKCMIKMISSSIASDKLAQIFISICGEYLDVSGQNLIRVMAKNSRLQFLPEVLNYFNLLKAKYEENLKIGITSAYELQYKQLAKIKYNIENLLLRKVILSCKIDKNIIAGILIHIGDVVIDGSVRGRLNRLVNTLVDPIWSRVI